MTILGSLDRAIAGFVRAEAAPVPAHPHTCTVLRFALPHRASACVEVFDVTGQRVRLLLDEAVEAGEHACAWDGLDERSCPVPTGEYVVRLAADGRVLTSRRVLIGG